jgi:hypothetical protein
VRHPELLGEDDADLAEALVVGLQPRQHQLELLVADGGRERLGDAGRVGRRQRVGLDVDGAIGPARQRLAQHLRGARRAGRADDDLAAVLLLEAQRFFERVGVRLVQLEAGVLVADPRARVVDAQLPLAGDNLFDAHGDFHFLLPTYRLLPAAA